MLTPRLVVSIGHRIAPRLVYTLLIYNIKDSSPRGIGQTKPKQLLTLIFYENKKNKRIMSFERGFFKTKKIKRIKYKGMMTGLPAM